MLCPETGGGFVLSIGLDPGLGDGWRPLPGRPRCPRRNEPAAAERSGIDRALACAVIGEPATVARGVEAFIERHRPDELMLTANVFDHTARMRSFELAAHVLRAMN